MASLNQSPDPFSEVISLKMREEKSASFDFRTPSAEGVDSNMPGFNHHQSYAINGNLKVTRDLKSNGIKKESVTNIPFTFYYGYHYYMGKEDPLCMDFFCRKKPMVQLDSPHPINMGFLDLDTWNRVEDGKDITKSCSSYYGMCVSVDGGGVSDPSTRDINFSLSTYIPFSGEYSSCSNRVYDHGVLYANCPMSGVEGLRTTELNYHNICDAGSLVNIGSNSYDNGALVCSSFINEIDNIKGSWKNSCSPINYDKGVLTASCRKLSNEGGVEYIKSSIDVINALGDIINDQGVLTEEPNDSSLDRLKYYNTVNSQVDVSGNTQTSLSTDENEQQLQITNNSSQKLNFTIDQITKNDDHFDIIINQYKGPFELSPGETKSFNYLIRSSYNGIYLDQKKAFYFYLQAKDDNGQVARKEFDITLDIDHKKFIEITPVKPNYYIPEGNYKDLSSKIYLDQYPNITILSSPGGWYSLDYSQCTLGAEVNFMPEVGILSCDNTTVHK